MAHFYGTLQGSRGAATRCGTRGSGLRVTAASWSGSVRVSLYQNREGQDCCHVVLAPWNGKGTDRALYSGPIDPDHSAARKEVV